MKFIIKLVLFFFFLAACSQPHLSIQTEFLRRENLASFHINSPDPLLNLPLIGQRLIVQWSLPETYLQYKNLTLEVVIRFVNRTQVLISIPANDLKGMYVYTIQNQEYCEKQGFFTYKADLVSNDCILESWRHQLWVELLEIGKEEP